jgi:hypothetical protein
MKAIIQPTSYFWDKDGQLERGAKVVFYEGKKDEQTEYRKENAGFAEKTYGVDWNWKWSEEEFLREEHS